MRYVREFAGFAGVRIEAEDIGSALDPSVILLHDLFETRRSWGDTAEALALAGRHPINVDLRGHGGSDWPGDGRYDANAFIGDIKALLGQMRTRPVIIAKGMTACFAILALEEDAALLASGLVVVDLPEAGAIGLAEARAGHKLAAHSHGQPQWDERLVAAPREADLLDRARQVLETISLPTLIANGPGDALCQPGADVLATPSSEASASPVEPTYSDAFIAELIGFLEQKQPLAAPEFRSGSDARTLRDAMGIFATGVTIITAADPAGGPIGLTANSFTSVSLDPPLLLVCVSNTSSSAAVLRQTDTFAVNVLQIGQQPTSNRFAGKVEDRFAETDWSWGETGVPVLAGSLGVFECTRHACHEAGDHFILVGHVHKASFEPRRDPLLYFRGKYRRLHFT